MSLAVNLTSPRMPIGVTLVGPRRPVDRGWQSRLESMEDPNIGNYAALLAVQDRRGAGGDFRETLGHRDVHFLEVA